MKWSKSFFLTYNKIWPFLLSFIKKTVRIPTFITNGGPKKNSGMKSVAKVSQK